VRAQSGNDEVFSALAVGASTLRVKISHAKHLSSAVLTMIIEFDEKHKRMTQTHTLHTYSTPRSVIFHRSEPEWRPWQSRKRENISLSPLISSASGDKQFMREASRGR
jgi:hypothetical protein